MKVESRLFISLATTVLVGVWSVSPARAAESNPNAAPGAVAAEDLHGQDTQIVDGLRRWHCDEEPIDPRPHEEGQVERNGTLHRCRYAV